MTGSHRGFKYLPNFISKKNDMITTSDSGRILKLARRQWYYILEAVKKYQANHHGVGVGGRHPQYNLSQTIRRKARCDSLSWRHLHPLPLWAYSLDEISERVICVRLHEDNAPLHRLLLLPDLQPHSGTAAASQQDQVQRTWVGPDLMVVGLLKDDTPRR